MTPDNMTLRDYFACQALTLMSGGWKPDEVLNRLRADEAHWPDALDYKTPVAVCAYRLADLMLAERSK